MCVFKNKIIYIFCLDELKNLQKDIEDKIKSEINRIPEQKSSEPR